MTAITPIPQYDLQPMTGADLDEVLAVEQRSFPFPWSFGVFADSLASGYRAWVARENGVVIAYALMMVVLDEVHLLNITVDPDRQGCGMGKALLRHLCADARSLGCKHMFLEVRPSNINALNMYLRFGFNKIGERRGYYPAANNTREDAIVMSCNLEALATAAAA